MASPGKKAYLLRIDPELWAEIERLAAQELRSANAVSYTHLDVYKRQAWAWMLTSSVLALSLAVLGRLVIELRGQVLHWHYGFFGWPRWQLPLGEIEDLQAARGAAAHAGIQLGLSLIHI